ncbi:MAG TPA: hypothetical protein VIH19_07805 [Candidatus Limnocylindria bacterium]
MTDNLPPTDRELAERIQRSMDHYRFPRSSVEPVRPRIAWGSIASLFAAAAAGAVVAIAVIGATGGLARMATSTSPSGTPSSGAASPTARPTPAPSAPGILPITDADATAACLAMEPSGVQADWLRSGESRAEVVERFGRLPLLIADRREGASIFVFADDQFVTTCGFTAEQEGPSSTMRGIRQLPENAAADVLYIRSSPMTVDEDGTMVPGGEPEIVAVGTAAPDVARLAVVLQDGTLLDARLSNGVWLAWWTEPLSGVAVRAFDAEGRRIDQIPADLNVMTFPEGGVEFSVPPDPSPSP